MFVRFTYHGADLYVNINLILAIRRGLNSKDEVIGTELRMEHMAIVWVDNPFEDVIETLRAAGCEIVI